MPSDYQNLACLVMVEIIHGCLCPSWRPCCSSGGSTGRRRSRDQAGSARCRICPRRRCPPSVVVRPWHGPLDSALGQGRMCSSVVVSSQCGSGWLPPLWPPAPPISRLRRRNFRRDAGLGSPCPLLPTAGCPFPMRLIVCPTYDGEGETFRL